LVGETVGVDHIVEFELLRLGGVLAAWNDHDVGSRPSLGLSVSVFLGLGIEVIKARKYSNGKPYLVVGDIMDGGLAFGALASRTFTLFLGGRLEEGWVRMFNEPEEGNLRRGAAHLRWQSTRSKPCAWGGVEGP
jgi:hypothetical protein